jgi:hypothetical protein
MNRTVFLGMMCIFALSLGIQTYAQNSSRANFGNYPADYELAYWRTLMGSKGPTIRKLFGPTAPFAKSIEGLPVSVTFETTTGNRTEFTAVLLVSVKNQNTGEEIKVYRMQTIFRADSMTEMSYLRYIKIANLYNGEIIEKRSRGGERENADLCSFFYGFMETFWDMAKL